MIGLPSENISTAQVLDLLPSPSSIISGAIHPSVPATPDRREKDIRPTFSFLQSPKSEIMALTSPRRPGIEISTFWGLMSLRDLRGLRI